MNFGLLNPNNESLSFVGLLNNSSIVLISKSNSPQSSDSSSQTQILPGLKVTELTDTLM